MQYINEANLTEKKVILRLDYNVPIENGKIVNTKKIDDTFETIDYLIEKKAKIIILSHFGRIKTEDDKLNNSLKPVYDYIKSLEKYNILFCSEAMGQMLDIMSKNLLPGQIILVENTRFLDLNGNIESSCDIQLSEYWANIADIYINDAFGSMHRNHASITGIPKYLPSYAGFLVKKEISNLEPLINYPESPFIVIMGGAKLDDKIELIYSLAEVSDKILIGGGIANTFLKATGVDVGSSLVSDTALKNAEAIMKEFPDKIVLPTDVITSPSYSNNTYELKQIENIVIDDIIGDIGSKTIAKYKEIIDSARTIFINGTVGMYEQKPFSNGTQEILSIISSTKAKKIVGGGDAGAAVKKFGYQDKVDFVSTGGGASLIYIADHTLKGIEAIKESTKKFRNDEE